MFSGALLLLPRGVLSYRSLAWTAARVVVASAALLAVARALLPASLPLAIVVGAVIYLVAILALRLVRVRDLLVVGQMGRGFVERRRAPAVSQAGAGA
jgi:hypothetical protein